MADLPPCALACLGQLLANSTCGPSDFVCQCTNADFNAGVSSCILASCTVREALSARNITSSQCGVSPTVDHSYLPPMYALLVLAGIAVLLRLTSRLSQGTKFGWDDACNILALLSGGAFLGIVIKATQLGLGTDIWAVDQDNITPLFKLVLSFFQVYGICRIIIRCSIILFYIRIFSLTRASKVLWGTFAVNLIIWITWFFISIFQCRPLSYFWTQWDGQHSGTCMSANFVAWSGGGVDLAQDLFILALPFPYLRRLRLATKNKIATSIMFAVGSLTVAFSIVRLTCIPGFTISVNTTLDAVPAILWSGLELYVGIICACLPSIYPLVSPMISWLDRYFHPPKPEQAIPKPSDLINLDPPKEDRRRYKPAWDVTLTGLSTTYAGDEEAPREMEAANTFAKPSSRAASDEVALTLVSTTASQNGPRQDRP